MKRQELFADYELDNSKWYSVILKIFGGSLALHLILFLAAVYIPALRDAFYVAMLFSDAPTGWSKADYNKTGIEEEVTIINTPRGDRFHYPAGYFGAGETLPTDPLASTTDLAALSGDTGLSPMTTPTPFAMATPMPTPYVPPYVPPVVNTPRRPTGGGLPKLPKVKKGATPPPLATVPGTGEATPQPTPKEVAKVEPSPTPAVVAQEENKLLQKPLLDLADKAIKQIKDNQLDLNKPVNVTVKGVLGDDGKFIGKPTYKNNGGDEQLAVMASELVAAMNDSNMLSYVKMLSDGSNKREVVFNVSKDEKQVLFQLVSVVGDEAQARRISSGLNFFFTGFKNAKKGTEEGELLEQVKFTYDKNQVVINWQMDTPTAMRKIQNKLAEVQKTPQSSSQSANSNAQGASK